MKQRITVTVRGIVQGVGFRPFLHRLAQRHSLCGWARNTAAGVTLELEGEPAQLQAFLHTLQTAPPPLAVLAGVESKVLPQLAGYTGFAIRQSTAGAAADTLVSPDIGICPDCLRELRTPTDRRYRYPFINCTNCGPRFTITRTIPYDRANTTMVPFAMCPTCQAEYGDITDRRYHAQPDCCPACGPALTFCGADGAPLAGDALAHAQALLQAGGILAVKGLGGFHLACLPTPTAVATLRHRKHREAKPLALMCPTVAAAQHFCTVSTAEAAVLEGYRKPIVLLQKRDAAAYPYLSANTRLGVLLPYTPLHVLLFDPPAGADGKHFVFDALVMTSANVSDLPAILTNEAALQSLRGIADGFLLHDRAIEARCDDSLLRVDGENETCFFRRSRGYAPQPLLLAQPADGILALGAEQKASFCLGKGQKAFASQHIGDLKNAETLAHYETQITRFSALFGAPVRRLVCDLHPDYLSTQYARRRAKAEALPLLQVQHHHAHLAACMADNGLTGQVLGLIWDGTGLGTDGTIWGGEWLIGGYGGFTRGAALRPVALPGGDAAIREIGRIGLALATDAACTDSLPFAPATRALLCAMLQKGLQCPQSSGMGRLFDGVYALLTGCLTAAYEGQAPALLETLAAPYATQTVAPLPAAWYTDAAALPRLDTRPLIRALCAARAAGEAPALLAARFHETLAQQALAGCVRLRTATGLDRVVLSGGVFFNALLLRRVTALLTGAGFTVYRHRRTSPGDEGLSLGQLAVAAAQPIQEGN